MRQQEREEKQCGGAGTGRVMKVRATGSHRVRVWLRSVIGARVRSGVTLLIALAAGMGSFLVVPAAEAATFSVGCGANNAVNVQTLVNAINAANDEINNPGPDTIQLLFYIVTYRCHRRARNRGTRSTPAGKRPTTGPPGRLTAGEAPGRR